MKQKKKEEKLQRRIDEYERSHVGDAGYTKPGSVNKSGGGKGRSRR